MIDLQMKYCFACQDEYLPEISKCGVCGSVLLSGAEMLAKQNDNMQVQSQRLGALTDKDDIVTIFKGPLSEAKRIEAKLVSENIGTRVLGEEGGCGKGCCATDVELLIRRADAPDAQQIIDLDFESMTGVSDFNHNIADTGYDPDAQTSTCPACGFTFSTAENTCPDCGLCFG